MITAAPVVRRRSDVERAEDLEILYWVGCCVSADDRVSAIARAMAKILAAAGVRFAVLGGEEHCCGDPARRTGNEFQFATLVQENLETFERYGVTRIVAHCPHCLNTFRNEYPRFGAKLEVLHHTELIRDLIDGGRLKLSGRLPETVTFHDPCYLARYNGQTEAPRRVLEAVAEKRTELARHGESTFCCGGGGGHSFFEAEGGEHINRLRARQVLVTGASTVCTACPYCLTMVRDGLLAEGGEHIHVKDIAEIVADLL